MSVYAFILNPINRQEKSLSFPVATESFFYKVWMLGCKSLRLSWIPLFATGIDVTKEDLFSLQIELQLLKKWAKNNLCENKFEQIEARINLCEKQLPKMFIRKDAIVFMG